MLDPRRLKPAELMRMLNTAGRGTVLTETRLRRHRNRAGYTIGDARTIDFLRYAAWLTLEYARPREEVIDYAEKKRRQAEKNAEAMRMPIQTHLSDFRQHLEAKNNSDVHIRKTVSRIEKILESCGWRSLREVEAGSLERFLVELRRRTTGCVVLDGGSVEIPSRRLDPTSP